MSLETILAANPFMLLLIAGVVILFSGIIGKVPILKIDLDKTAKIGLAIMGIALLVVGIGGLALNDKPPIEINPTQIDVTPEPIDWDDEYSEDEYSEDEYDYWED
jgi:hypothetical protein